MKDNLTEATIKVLTEALNTRHSRISKTETKNTETNSLEINFNVDKENDLWINGNVSTNGKEYRINAKVFLDGSEFGIDNGQISKLFIVDKSTNKTIVNYDRGWETKPDKSFEPIYAEIIKALVEFRNNNPYEITESTNLVENNDDTYVAVVNGTIYWEGTEKEATENDENIRLTVQGVAQEDGLNIDTDEIDIMKKSDFETK